MIVTVLWEDQRGTETKGFGPHELLISCVADRLGRPRESLKALIESHPKKGVANVRNAVRHDIARLENSGPVFVVVDRDRIRDLWRQGPTSPADCMSQISLQFRADAPGAYDLIFLIDNVESLINLACQTLQLPVPSIKPSPDERDRLLAKMAWGSEPQRAALRKACPSFDRLVQRIADRIG